MSFSPVPCGPFGASGRAFALGLLADTREPSLPTSIQVVVAVDEFGKPPTLKLGDGRRLRYMYSETGYVVGNRVLVIENGLASYVSGKLVATPGSDRIVDPTAEWFYTGSDDDANPASEHPAIGFRFYQGNADPQGKYTFDSGFDPADILIADCRSPEYASLSRHIARPIEVLADGTVSISGMRPGHMFKVMLLVKNDSPPGGTPIYNYVATGQNAMGDPRGDHPLVAFKIEQGTLDANGQRSGGGLGIGSNRILGLHVRAIVDGKSVDVSRYTEPAETGDALATRITNQGRIDNSLSRRPDLANAPYTITIMYQRNAANADAAGTNDELFDYIGKDAIGSFPEFEILRRRATQIGGWSQIPTNVEDIEFRSTAIFAMSNHDGGANNGYAISAELWSESQNNYRFVDHRNGSAIHNTETWSIHFLLRGGDTALDV